jgi:two-component system response regulator AtoC
MARAVLIIEDERVLAKNLCAYLVRQGYEAEAVESGREGLARIESFHPDVVLLDYSLPDINGLEILAELQARQNRTKVIMMTGHGSVGIAVQAMKQGAYDYLSKPVSLGEIKLLLDKACGAERLESTLSYYRGREASESGLAKLLGTSPPMMAMKEMITRVIRAERALTDGELPAVLITGETGTGKELVARALHYEGLRRERPFVEINCASIPSPLLEAELFGYEKGAFTDARERKLGLTEMADGGTLFLDEVGELEAGIQAKLLKLLEDKTVRRIGGLREQKVNVRIVAATNQDLERMVRDGRFRSDLFFRLRIIHIGMPTLRARGNDILLLARRFLSLHGARYGKGQMRFSPEAEQQLLEYAWPGNVRELRNAIEQTVLMASTDVIEPLHLPFCHILATPRERDAEPRWASEQTGPSVPAHASENFSLQEVERALVAQALQRTAGNVTRAAKLLGLSRDTLRYRMEKYGIKPSI